ncbi:MAG: tetratricopeptide repeat protein [Nitrospirae bacterium]|nr:tetratricopeptide repeat protein [Nitrospirota bacterium]
MGKSSRENLFRNPIFHLLLIAIVGLLAYSNTFHVPFLFDDKSKIIENYKLKDVANLWPPFGSRWLGFLSFALNYKLHGFNVAGYHIFNLVVHILNAILVYWLVTLTLRVSYCGMRNSEFGMRNSENNIPHSAFGIPHFFSPIHLFTYLPLFIALIFVSHPIQTQAVTYIYQRFASLATFFYLLSLVMYIKFRIHDTKKMHDAGYTIHDKEKHTSCIMNRASCIVSQASCIMYLASLFSAVLAMKTKEIAFTLPFIIALYEFSFFNGSRITDYGSRITRRLLYLLPFLLTLIIIPFSFIGPELGIYIPEMNSGGEGLRQFQLKDITTLSKYEYFLTQFRVIVTYIRLLFLPINQNLDYDYPTYNSLLEPQVVLSFFFLLSIFGLGVYLFYRSRKNIKVSKGQSIRVSEYQSFKDSDPMTLGRSDTSFIAFGILWFFITLSVESSIIPIRDVIFEHRLYLPSVGFITAFSMIVFYYAARITHHVLRITRYAFPLVLTTVVIVLSIAAYQRNTVWKDVISLWEDVIKKSPGKARGHNNLSAGYKDKRMYDRAIEHSQIALRLKPDYLEAYINLGDSYRYKGLIDKAIIQYQSAIKINPDFGRSYSSLGTAYYEKGLFDTALEYYRIALQLPSDYPEKIHNNMGVIFKNKGVLDIAVEHFRFASILKPDYTEAHNNLGAVYEEEGLLEEAMTEYQTALHLNPDNKVIRNNINRVLQMKNR